MPVVAVVKPRILPPKGLLIALVAQLPLIVSARLHPSPVELMAGGALLITGAMLNVWAARLFRRENVGVCPFTPVPVLITRGPYRFTRNPMYIGVVFLNLGVTLMTGVLANVWSSVALAIWLHYAFVVPEEAFLRQQIGPAFAEYARRVPRWLGAGRWR